MQVFEKHADEMQMMTWQSATRKKMTWQRRRITSKHLAHRIWGVTWTYTERLQSHLGETEIPIGETDLPRVSGSGYDIKTRWRRIERISGAVFDFTF